MTDVLEWRGRVGDAWAEEWRRTDRTLAPLNDALVARAAALRPASILDIGCGAGATSLALAEALPGARITGLDLSEALAAVARDRTRGRPGLRIEVGDAASWRPGTGMFDLIVSRHGVMFFADAEAAFAHLRSLLAPAGSLLFSCFRAREENEWIAAQRPILARFAPEALDAPDPAVGPFAFADPARIEAVLAAAGFPPPRIEPLDFDFVIGDGAEPVAEAVHYLSRIGPLARLLADFDPEPKRQAIGEIEKLAAARLDNGQVAFRAAAWIVSCPSA